MVPFFKQAITQVTEGREASEGVVKDMEDLEQEDDETNQLSEIILEAIKKGLQQDPAALSAQEGRQYLRKKNLTTHHSPRRSSILYRDR